MSDSQESTVPWSQVRPLIKASRETFLESCKEFKIDASKALFSTKITHIYDNGATVYLHWGFNHSKNRIPLENVMPNLHKMTLAIRKTIIRHGGSISHTNGVGKLKKEYYAHENSTVWVKILQDLKSTLDPKNIFAVQNTFYTADITPENDMTKDMFGLEVSTYSETQKKAAKSS